MAVSTMKVILPHSVEKVWETVTSLQEFSWRSDISRIEILDDKSFIEYTKGGYPTRFTVTCIEPCSRWEFDMENDNMCGHWTGEFRFDGEQTVIEFTENVVPKKLFMKPFIGMYLKKQQTAYAEDLKKALG